MTRLNVTVPAYVGCGVGTADIGVPGAGDGVVVVLPVNLPAVGCGGTVVGDADSAGESGAPLVGNDILATRHCRATPGCSREAQPEYRRETISSYLFSKHRDNPL